MTKEKEGWKCEKRKRSRNRGGSSTRRVSLKEIAGKDPDVGQPGETSPDGRVVIRAHHLSRSRQSFRTSREDHSSTYGNAIVRHVANRHDIKETNRIDCSFLYNRHKNDSIASHKFVSTNLFLYKKSEMILATVKCIN